MRRAQLQAMETIIITIILVLIVLLGLWFYSQATTAQTTQAQQTLDRERVENLATRLSSIPELSCPEHSVESRVCIDKLKAQILSEWLTNPQSPGYDAQTSLYYTSVFGESTIIIQEVYPGAWSTTLYEGAQDNYIQNDIPIVLHDPTTDSKTLATITVRT